MGQLAWSDTDNISSSKKSTSELASSRRRCWASFRSFRCAPGRAINLAPAAGRSAAACRASRPPTRFGLNTWPASELAAAE